jgi:hypothetical protein
MSPEELSQAIAVATDARAHALQQFANADTAKELRFWWRSLRFWTGRIARWSELQG